MPAELRRCSAAGDVAQRIVNGSVPGASPASSSLVSGIFGRGPARGGPRGARAVELRRRRRAAPPPGRRRRARAGRLPGPLTCASRGRGRRLRRNRQQLAGELLAAAELAVKEP